MNVDRLLGMPLFILSFAPFPIQPKQFGFGQDLLNLVIIYVEVGGSVLTVYR